MKSRSFYSLFLLGFCLLFMSKVTAQEDTWSIVTLAGDTLSACTLDSVLQTTLCVTSDGVGKVISIDSIGMVFREGMVSFQKGATIGALVGLAGGTIVGLVITSSKDQADSNPLNKMGDDATNAMTVAGGALIGGVVGALIGSAGGAARARANTHDLTNKNQEEKLQIIEPLTMKEKIR